MNQKSLISVIIPVYKVEPYLRKCIDSVLAQTFTNLEVILVDDGSPDNCGAICDEYAKKDERVKVLHQENGGQAVARNRGISVAKGEYIGFVDGDDWIAPDMYEVLYDSLMRNHCDISICGRYSVRGEEICESSMFHLPEETVMNTEEAVKRFLTYKAVDSSLCDKLYKKELFDGVTMPAGYICEDVPVVYTVLSRAKKVVHCAKPLYYCLHREGSTSRASFSERSMGLYYHFKEVRLQCLASFPMYEKEADFLYLKNLLVLAYRIASARGRVKERKLVNSEVRKEWKKILSSPFLKRKHKLFAWSVFLHAERPLSCVAQFFDIRMA